MPVTQKRWDNLFSTLNTTDVLGSRPLVLCGPESCLEPAGANVIKGIVLLSKVSYKAKAGAV